MPLHVFFDSTVFVGTPFLDRGAWTPVMQAVRDRRVLAAISSVSVSEADRHLDGELTKLRKELRKLVGSDDAASAATPLHRHALFGPGARQIAVLPPPAIPHEAVITRAIERRKPFDAQGRNGYRDTMIWYTLLDWIGHLPVPAEGLTVYFVSNNTNDFAEGTPPRLHAQLAGDLHEGVTVTLVPKLDDLQSLIAQLAPSTERRELVGGWASMVTAEEIDRRLGQTNLATWPLQHPVVMAGATDVRSVQLVGDEGADVETWHVTIDFSATLDGWVAEQDRPLLRPDFKTGRAADWQGQQLAAQGTVEGSARLEFQVSSAGERRSHNVLDFVIHDGRQVPTGDVGRAQE